MTAPRAERATRPPERREGRIKRRRKRSKMTDEIIQEVWRCEDRLAKEFNCDINALAAELPRRQKRSERKVVNLAEKTTRQTADRRQ